MYKDFCLNSHIDTSFCFACWKTGWRSSWSVSFASMQIEGKLQADACLHVDFTTAHAFQVLLPNKTLLSALTIFFKCQLQHIVW